MKKTMMIMMLLLAMLCCGVAFAEEETYPTAGDWYNVWHDKLPDYVCGVWANDPWGRSLTIGVQNTPEGNAGKETILAMVEEDATVSFVYQTYSRNYLMEVMEELTEYFEKDLGVVGAGLRDQNNYIVVEVHVSKIEEEATQELIEEIKNRYGDVIQVQTTDGWPVDNTLLVEKSTSSRPPYVMYAIIAAVCVVAVAIFAMVQKSQYAVRQTSGGETVMERKATTLREAEELVRGTNCSISPALEQRIADSIEKIR